MTTSLIVPADAYCYYEGVRVDTKEPATEVLAKLRAEGAAMEAKLVAVWTKQLEEKDEQLRAKDKQVEEQLKAKDKQVEEQLKVKDRQVDAFQRAVQDEQTLSLSKDEQIKN